MPPANTNNTHTISLQGVAMLFYMQNAKWLMADPVLGF